METFNPTLAESDPELLELIRKEKSRQSRELELIASENFANRSVLQTLSSCLHNKYSEGYPGQRHYGGNEFIDQIEILCQKRSLEAYDLNPEEWGVNVQPYSGSLANLCVYTAVVEPHGRIMGLDLTDGGHITHGFFTAKKRISSTSKFFESMPYKIDPATGLINYDQLETLAKLFKPKLIIAGISCYPRHLDYKRFREIADQNDSLLMGDMAHVSSLVTTKLAPNPFEHCDIVTTTTHKTLRGPRAGMIFYRKGVRKVTKAGEIIKYDLEERINSAVFPGIQGGPHNNTVAGIATAMKNVKNPQFRKDQEQVLLNAKTLASSLMDKGFTIVTGGTDNHLVCVDLRPLGLTGALAEKILEDISIACNKNSVPGDKSLMNPSGIRLGSPALTTRGLKESDMEKVAEFFHQGIQLVSNVPSLKDYKIKIVEDSAFQEKVKELRNKVESFAVQFPLPGFEDY